MTLLEQQLLVLDDQQRAADATGVGVDADLSVADVAHLQHAAFKTRQKGDRPSKHCHTVWIFTVTESTFAHPT